MSLSDSEDDFNDCSYSTDDHHSTSDVDNRDDMSNCESLESILSENLIVDAVPNTATTFSSALEGQSTSCAYVDLSSAYVDLTTVEGGDNIVISSSEDTRPEDENKDSSLNITCSADESNNILSNTCDSHSFCTSVNGYLCTSNSASTGNVTLSIANGGAPSTSESANTAASEEINNNGIVECDIKKLLHNGVNLKTLSRENKYTILKHKPNPSVYPWTHCHGSTSYRQFQPKWVKQYTWLHYSPQVDGVFCKACIFFAPDKVQ